MTVICSFLSLYLLWGHIRGREQKHYKEKDHHSTEKFSTAAEIIAHHKEIKALEYQSTRDMAVGFATEEVPTPWKEAH